jgi:transmembrane sensor
MDSSRLNFLMDQVKLDRVTAAELEEILSALRTDQSGETTTSIENFISTHFDKTEQTIHDRAYWQSALDEIISVKKTLPSIQAPATSKPVYMIKPWLRIAAAIVVLFCLGSYFIYQYYHKNTATADQLVSNQKARDIAPGGNRAILTLANGSKIILDSARNGVLTKQDGTSVTKTGNGLLAYNNAGNNTGITKSGAISYNTLTTPRGGQYQLILPDGTKVWLNAASSITFPTAFTGASRIVTITGEAYLEVVHNVKMPFIVHAAGQAIEDIGTAFNINTYNDEVTSNTTLVQGAVKITLGLKPGKYGVVLKPGEQAQTDKAGEIRIVTSADLKQVLAWKNGKIALTNSTLQQVMMNISRWYDVDIQYAGAIPDKKFNGSIDRNVPLLTVLKGLQINGIETRLEGKTIIVQ